MIFWMWSNLLYPVVSTAAGWRIRLGGADLGRLARGGHPGRAASCKPGAALFCASCSRRCWRASWEPASVTVVISGLVQGLE
ncbi:hypothetical protein QJS66_17950 [Kocuria rhizophila]|nr:hypothetical protein QJS66_17950 [Kocuria rhizophila]